MDGRLGDIRRAALESLGHRVHVATPGYVSAPFSMPNGIREIGGGLESGVYPAGRQGAAAGIRD
jgi:hypothetical protein